MFKCKSRSISLVRVLPIYVRPYLHQQTCNCNLISKSWSLREIFKIKVMFFPIEIVGILSHVTKNANKYVSTCYFPLGSLQKICLFFFRLSFSTLINFWPKMFQNNVEIDIWIVHISAMHKWCNFYCFNIQYWKLV